MNATHLKLGRKLGKKSNGIGNGIIYMVRRDSMCSIWEFRTDSWVHHVVVHNSDHNAIVDYYIRAYHSITGKGNHRVHTKVVSL